MITSLMPDFSSTKTTEQKVDEAIRGYMQLRRELEYQLQTLDMSNMSKKFQLNFSELTGGLGELTVTAAELGTRMTDAEGNITSIKQTATSLTSRVAGAEGNISEINQWADFIETRVGNQNGSIAGSINSTITQHANLISLKVNSSDYNGNTIVSKINLTGTTATISAQRIDLQGYVTITSLSQAGATVINGANIRTGYISADRIQAGTITADKLTFTPLSSADIGPWGSTVIDAGRIQSGTIEGIVIRSRNPNYGNFIEMTGDNITSYDGSYNYHGVRIVSSSSPEMQYWYNGGLFFQIYYSPYDGKVYLYANAPLKIQGQYGVSMQSITDYIWFDSNVRLNNGVGIYDVNNVLKVS